MKKFLKILKWTGVILLLIIIGFVITVYAMQGKTYDAPYPDIHASTDSAVIARGEYLAYGPAHCSGCHISMADTEAIKRGEHIPFRGGWEYLTEIGIIRTPNITPDSTGIGKLTDSQIARSLRYGIGYDGRPIFDLMPFHNLSDEDLTAIISFLRAQKPVKNVVKRMDLNFLGKAVYAFLIKPIGPVGDIPKSVTADTTAIYGEYIANKIADCKGCHTERNLMSGEYIGQLFAGGGSFEHPDKGYTLVTPNLTPDKETGRIADWTEELFINRFRKGRLIASSDMPWDQFKNISDNDLKALYKFLHSLQPVHRDNGPVIQPIKN